MKAKVGFALMALLLVLLTTSSAWADSLPAGDPHITIGSGSSSEYWYTPEETDDFSFTISNGTFDLLVQNATGHTWNDITITGPGNGLIGCTILAYFGSCVVTQTSNSTTIFISGVPGDGVNNGQNLNIDFTVDTNGSWTNGTYDFAANVPEPASLSLLLIGIALIAGFAATRKFQLLN
jgi:hypothetical protein